MSEEKKTDFTGLVVIAAGVLLLWWFVRRSKIPAAEPATTEPEINDQFRGDPDFNLKDYCQNVVYKPLSSTKLIPSGLLGRGWCYRGDTSIVDPQKGFGDAYAETQAKAYAQMKQAEAIRVNNKKYIQFRLINSTAAPIITDVLNTAQDSTPFTPIPLLPVAVTDIDGNDYHSVIIGTQEWLIENLKTTKYANGTPILNITDNALWVTDVTGAYCWYNNDISYKTPYGALYNWYAVNNANGLAPAGWRIPSLADFNNLASFLGGDSVAGRKLKEIGTSHWDNPNIGTDEVGFKAVGAGIRGNTGNFDNINIDNRLRSDSLLSIRILFNYSDAFFIGANVLNWGLSVRCMRDV